MLRVTIVFDHLTASIYASETILKFRTLSIVENLKQSCFKLGSVTLRVRFRSIFKNFRSVAFTCYCCGRKKYASNNFLIVSRRLYYYLFTVLLPFFPQSNWRPRYFFSMSSFSPTPNQCNVSLIQMFYTNWIILCKPSAFYS